MFASLTIFLQMSEKFKNCKKIFVNLSKHSNSKKYLQFQKVLVNLNKICFNNTNTFYKICLVFKNVSVPKNVQI